MRVAIIGAGNVGGNLGAALAAVGHLVAYGVRDPESLKASAAVAGAAGSDARDPQSAVDGAELVILALHWDVLPDVLEGIHVPVGTIVVDATNRLTVAARPGSAPSSGEEVARLLPGTRVVKAFNTIGAENLPTLRSRTSPPAGFLCGDDEGAKAVVAEMAAAIGFEPFDVGPLAMAGVLEGMTRVWVGISGTHGRSIAFAMARD